MLTAFHESAQPDAKFSMTRIVMFAFVVLAYIAVFLNRDAATVSAIIVGGVGAALSKAWEVKSENKECSPTK